MYIHLLACGQVDWIDDYDRYGCSRGVSFHSLADNLSVVRFFLGGGGGRDEWGLWYLVQWNAGIEVSALPIVPAKK